jgi:hypothetical protein
MKVGGAIPVSAEMKVEDGIEGILSIGWGKLL